MIPVVFPEANFVLGEAQDEYEPLPCHLDTSSEGRVTLCFRLSEAEIENIVRYRTLWIQQLTFKRGFQPIGLTTDSPFKG